MLRNNGIATNKPETFFLIEYIGIIDEINLNWGFKSGYFYEEKIPVLFIYSNFPIKIKTNRQSLLGSIRTHVEEQKGIIFFPHKMKNDLMQFVHDALKKEGMAMNFHPYMGAKYEPSYLAHMCDTCFSIKNINLLGASKSTNTPSVGERIILEKSTIHYDMIKDLEQSETKEISAIIIDKGDKNIVKSFHLEQKISSKRVVSFQDIVKDKAFKTRFFDLFSGEDSTPERIKRFYEGKNWKFQSLLILYSSRHKRVFIQDLPGYAFCLVANDTTFIGLNTEYSLISYNYKEQPDQKISITKNSITDKFDILVDGIILEGLELKHAITATFPGCTALVNQFLQMITHNQSNEYRFFYDKMAVIVKISGNRFLIDTYEAR